MKTRCPKCGYEGSIKDDLIPEGGRKVGCPQCKATFTVNRTGTEQRAESGTAAPRDVEVDGRDFIPLRQREARDTREGTDRLVGRIAVFALSLAAMFVVGFLIGRYTHNYTFTSPLKHREAAPAGEMTPASPAGGLTESETSPGTLTEAGNPPTAPAAPPETRDTETALPSEPLILEESFTNDVFLDITEIDGELNKSTVVTGLQRELELKDYAQGLVSKMLVGYFVVDDVGKLGPSFSKVLPLSLYSYYIQAEADSSDPIKSVVYVGLKKVDEVSSSLDRGTRVYVRGFIYSCTLASDHFEIGVANPKVEASR
jgi:predicted Zn finger-like uncharacterized protein